MTLVERFIEFDRWPVSRKTVLLCGIGLPVQALNSLIVTPLVVELPWVDAQWLRLVAYGLLAALAFTFVLSIAADRRGSEGRWTAVLLILSYGFMTAVFIWASGGMSSAAMLVFPVNVLLVTFWYGPRYGLLAALYGFCLSVAVLYLTMAERIPFAPIFVDRGLDVQNSGLFVAALGYVLTSFFLFCFALAILVLMARRAQQARLDEALQQLGRSTMLIRRYVPAQVADAILSGRAETTDPHERRKLTLFFSDLVGFTEIAEELEPEDLSRVLNEYFSEMTAIAQRHGGTIDELSGDAILIFFGAPSATNDKDHALRAARMAREMQQAMGPLNARWRVSGIGETLSVRMGINTGVVTIGNFGSPDRMKYAALGKHVNLAARLQSHCEPGKVLLSHATWLLVNDQLSCIPKGELQLKGLHKPVMTYELVESP